MECRAFEVVRGVVVAGLLLLATGSPGLAARGESPSAFDRRCIPPRGVAQRSNIPDILASRSLRSGRIAGLVLRQAQDALSLSKGGATTHFHHELLAQTQPPAGRGVPVMLAPASPQPPEQRPGTGQQLPTLPPLATSQLEERQRSQEVEQTLSLSFSEPVPVRELLLLLVRDTNISVVPDPDVEGSFAGELKNVTMTQALDLILRPQGLDFLVRDNVLRVFKKQLQTRIFQINYVATRRGGSRGVSGGIQGASNGAMYGGYGGGNMGAGSLSGGMNAGNQGSGGGLGGGNATSFASDGTDLFEELGKGLDTIASGDGKYNLDRKAGLLQMTDYPDRLDRVAMYLEAVETRVLRQVQIQAQVVEVELRDEFSAGINWNTVFRVAGNSATVTQKLAPNTTGAFTMGLNIRDFSGIISAFATQGKVNVLASPRVVAMNNEPAVIRVGTQDVFFVTNTQVDAGTGAILQTSVTPQSINEGISLSVTPQISADGIIHLSITPSITERTGQATSRLGDTVPIISIRETDTLVRVHEGETIVIAGLMQERATVEKTKVPVLGDVPLIGGLFRSETRLKRKTDLVIMLTPTILTPGQIVAEAVRDQQRLYEETKAPVKK
jgi:MSHA biogenesis protein MshL